MFTNDTPPGAAQTSDSTRVRVPLLPLRDVVVFPGMVLPLFVGRERSIRAVEEAVERDKVIVLAAQRKSKVNDPGPNDIFQVGTLSTLVSLLRLPDGTVKVRVEGRTRVRITKLVSEDGCFFCEVEPIEDEASNSLELEALVLSVHGLFEDFARLNRKITPEQVGSIQAINDPGRLADAVVVHLGVAKLENRQEVLELSDTKKRLERLHEFLTAEVEILEVEKKIRARVKKQMEKTQKEYYLNEQMQAIQRELGERDEFRTELQEIEEALRKKSLSKEASTKVRKELRKLKMMQPMSAEATVIRSYLDWVIGIPWGDFSEEVKELGAAEKVFDEDHYGLKKVKDRILEHLAVSLLKKQLTGPVLCLVGPPGVGKTSLARSIARATGREFVRMSLGGVRDEAEIRGHRRTYIGALPGRIVQGLRKAGKSNPVFLLDEIDKMTHDFRGDPASALLEVLDPEQNRTFNDHYLELDYDLSGVMFLCTANSLSGIPHALQDRLEIIHVSGYTEDEKRHIAQKYLVPKQITAMGLSSEEVAFKSSGIARIIRSYTRESGVRSLEREIGSVCRKLARKKAAGLWSGAVTLEAFDVERLLGVRKYRAPRETHEPLVGVTTGLAYTSYGGSTLQCEVGVVPGKGKLVITGLLEKGMQESAQAAMSYIRSRQAALGLDPDFYQKLDIHIHFPEFVPKDGPSAGITMATSIASALLRIPVKRQLAMTGEITLRGRILPIGGLKEKLLAAKRAGIQTVLVPKENKKDLREVPRKLVAALRIVLVEHMDQVLTQALELNAEQQEQLSHVGEPKDYRRQRLSRIDGKPVLPAPGPSSPQ